MLNIKIGFNFVVNERYDFTRQFPTAPQGKFLIIYSLYAGTPE